MGYSVFYSPQPPKPQAPETPWSEEENAVFHLTDDDFDKFIKEHSSVLVMFYAPCEYVLIHTQIQTICRMKWAYYI